MGKNQDMSTCRHCGREYDRKDLKRSLGEESKPYLLGYCSAQCYTKSQVMDPMPKPTDEGSATRIMVKTTVVVTDQDVDDIMVTALEGGINHWCGEAFIKDPPPKGAKFEFMSEALSKGGSLWLSDVEDPKQKWELNKEKFYAGLSRFLEKNPDKFEQDGTIDPGNIDAADADEIVQFAVFGEQVFG